MAVPRELGTDCCIVGGGPAGLMLGYLLARAGVSVIVLEKHADFLRDFRGDTVHPSTMVVMHELGLLERFLARPHDRVDALAVCVGGTTIRLADFRHLAVAAPYIALMPQWDFLDFLAGEARGLDDFRLLMEVEATGLIEEEGEVTGVAATSREGPIEIRAALVVGADGRRSTVRDRSGLEVRDLGAPMDVLWLRLPRRGGDPDIPLGFVEPGRMFVMIARGDYFQCGYIVAKGADAPLRAAGLEAFRASVAGIVPTMADRMASIESWDEVKTLTVTVDRLTRWARPGLLCIGDAAHAMSPVGGVGINLAIQDAVATANLLAGPLRRGRPRLADLAAVQRRRDPPTRITQALQVVIQKRVIRATLEARRPLHAPWPLLAFNRFPALRRIPARLVGLGIRPEHVRVPGLTGVTG
ncbi:MAG: FAD-dependent oxidoreductase [Caulobacteraceae bacterium]